MLKRVLNAFLVGAGAGLVGELCLSLTLLFLPAGMAATMVSVILFGLIAMVLIMTGKFDKIAAFGGQGGSICLCGLMYGAGMGCAAARKAGASEGKAAVTGFWAVFQILGSGFLIAFIIGLLIH